ncbi:MAG: T9SS type A sorting domain-containing protein [Parafilimonas sp.]
MKKIYTVLTAVILLSVSAISQQSFNVSNNIGHHINISNVAATENLVPTKMTIIGNPVRDAIILQINNPDAVKYELSLYNENGTKVSSILYNHPAGVSTETMYVSQLEHGMYFLIARSANEKLSMNLLVE